LTPNPNSVRCRCEQKRLQRTPHVVLLSRSFYHHSLRPLLAKWLLCWLKRQQLSELSWEEALQYLMDGPKSAVAGVFEENINDQVSVLGDAMSFLGDTKSSLGVAKSSLGDAKSSLGDAMSFLGDTKSSLGDTKSSLGDA
jgi:hypothetical protein